MNASTTAPVTIQISRGRLFGLIACVAAVAAAITWGVGSATGTDSGPVPVSTPAAPISSIPVTGYLDAVKRNSVKSVTSLTPVQLIEAFGTDVRTGIALASLTPKERLHVESIITSSPDQLRAAFGTSHVDPFSELGLSPNDAKSVRAITSLTPAQLVAGFGTGR